LLKLLLERGQTDTQTDASERNTHAGGYTGVNNNHAGGKTGLFITQLIAQKADPNPLRNGSKFDGDATFMQKRRLANRKFTL